MRSPPSQSRRFFSNPHNFSFFKKELAFAEVLFLNIVVESLKSSLGNSLENFIVQEELNYLLNSLFKGVTNVANVIFLREDSQSYNLIFSVYFCVSGLVSRQSYRILFRRFGINPS